MFPKMSISNLYLHIRFVMVTRGSSVSNSYSYDYETRHVFLCDWTSKNWQKFVYLFLKFLNYDII